MGLEGPLAQRRWLNPPVLPPQPFSDLLPDTVVQVVVGTEGRTVSPALLSPVPNVSPEADRLALETARSARFEPMKDEGSAGAKPPLQKLTWGKMIFQWHTVAVAPTNQPTSEP